MARKPSFLQNNGIEFSTNSSTFAASFSGIFAFEVGTTKKLPKMQCTWSITVSCLGLLFLPYWL